MKSWISCRKWATELERTSSMQAGSKDFCLQLSNRPWKTWVNQTKQIWSRGTKLSISPQSLCPCATTILLKKRLTIWATNTHVCAYICWSSEACRRDWSSIWTKASTTNMTAKTTPTMFMASYCLGWNNWEKLVTSLKVSLHSGRICLQGPRIITLGSGNAPTGAKSISMGMLAAMDLSGPSGQIPSA